MVPVPPVALNATGPYGLPVVACGRFVCVKVIALQVTLTVSVYVNSCGQPLPPATRRTMGKTPASAGVPLSTLVLVNVMPAGSTPLTRCQTGVPLSPVAVIWMLKAWLMFAVDAAGLVTVIGTHG